MHGRIHDPRDETQMMHSISKERETASIPYLAHLESQLAARTRAGRGMMTTNTKHALTNCSARKGERCSTGPVFLPVCACRSPALFPPVSACIHFSLFSPLYASRALLSLLPVSCGSRSAVLLVQPPASFRRSSRSCLCSPAES